MKMPSLREQALDALAHAAQNRAWHSCLESCFRAFYQLPCEVQIELARLTLSAYLAEFQNRWPNVHWPLQVLTDTPSWLATHGRALPDHPSVVGPADAAFFQGLDGLLLAHTFHSRDFFGVTASCVFAIGKGIEAQADAMWEAGDPEGVRAWQALSSSQDEGSLEQAYAKLAGHSVADNASAIEVMAQGWRSVADWLRSRRIQQYPDSIPDALEKDLLRWKDREMTLPAPPS
jgi:hypothetical protein